MEKSLTPIGDNGVSFIETDCDFEAEKALVTPLEASAVVRGPHFRGYKVRPVGNPSRRMSQGVKSSVSHALR